MSPSKPPRGVFGTAVCIRCLKRKATRHSGHVTIGRRTILAGWCTRCSDAREASKFPGWFGHWTPEMNPRCGDTLDPGDGEIACIRDRGHKGRHTDGGDAWSAP